MIQSPICEKQRNPVILKHSEQVDTYTKLKDVFLPFRDEVIHYNWLISDYEVNVSELFDNGIAWLSGEEILDFADNNDIQFIWGVISAFKKNYQFDLDNIAVIPVAGEHKTLWTNDPSTQHPDRIL